MRPLNEIKKKKDEMEAVAMLATEPCIIAAHSAIALALEWVMGTEEGDDIDRLLVTLSQIQASRAAMN